MMERGWKKVRGKIVSKSIIYDISGHCLEREICCALSKNETSGKFVTFFVTQKNFFFVGQF
jgi:hypothetical protein